MAVAPTDAESANDSDAMLQVAVFVDSGVWGAGKGAGPLQGMARSHVVNVVGIQNVRGFVLDNGINPRRRM